MKKTMMALMAMAGLAVAAEETSEWTFTSSGKYNGTEGAPYPGMNFTLGTDMSADRVSITSTPEGATLTQTLVLDSISITTRGGQNVTGTYSMYVVDESGKLMAVASNSITLNTGKVATDMVFDYTHSSSYGDNATLSTGVKYYAFLLQSSYMEKNWTDYEIGSIIPGSHVNSIQLAAYGVGNNTAQAEWGCAGANRSVMIEKFTPMATVKVHTIPEPATATLSLLTLAGLAARRRRK